MPKQRLKTISLNRAIDKRLYTALLKSFSSDVMLETKELFDIKEASVWATGHLGKTVTPSNIAYLINYGRIAKAKNNESVLIAKDDLLNYYKAYKNSRENVWKDQLGEDLNWDLLLEKYTESPMFFQTSKIFSGRFQYFPRGKRQIQSSPASQLKFIKQVFFI